MRSPVKLISLILGALWLALIPATAQEKIIKSHGISTYGDLHYDADFKHLGYVNPDAPKGGSYATWNIGSFDSLHPYIIKGRASHLASSFLFEPLMTTVADDPDAMYGLIAESIEYPENRQWAIFKLRDEARFSDGSDITADDVVFTYDILLEKGIPSLKSVFSDIEKVETLDADRVKFTFREGAATKTLPSLAAGLPVFSKAFWATRDFAESTLEPGIGSGPYVIDKVDVARSVVLRRDPNYWGKDLPINQGRNNFDTIREEFFGDANTAFEAFKAGALLFRVEGEAKKWKTGYDFPAMDKKWVVKEELPDGSLPVASGFFFNLRKEKFQDIRVRQALGLVFNFEWTNSTLFFDTNTRQDSFWENSVLEATGMPSAEEIAILTPFKEHFPETLFTEPAVSPQVSGKGQIDRKLVRQANKLLDAAGWKLVNGVRMKDGEELTVEFMLASDTAERFISPYVDNMRKIGVKGSIAIIDASQFLERRSKHDYDVMTTRHVTSLIPDIGLRQWFGSANAPLASRNLTGIQNPGVDALIEMALKADNREDMTVVIHALDRALRSLHIWVPRWYRPNHWVAYWDTYGRPENIPPYALGVADFWWWDQAKFDKLTAAGANINK
jgi:microcin C transport system substrate-binding protein